MPATGSTERRMDFLDILNVFLLLVSIVRQRPLVLRTGPEDRRTMTALPTPGDACTSHARASTGRGRTPHYDDEYVIAPELAAAAAVRDRSGAVTTIDGP